MNEMNEIYSLECPRCGERNLHHKLIRIYGRPEDGPTAYTEISADAADPKQKPWVDDFPENQNPSPRRDAVSIVFQCEQCEGGLSLNIWQHKGCTNYSWTEEKT
jgi:hypothetical protein